MGSLLKVAGVVLLVAGCGSKLPTTGAQQGTVIGASGGMVVSSDGVVALTIPSGALTGDVAISIAPTNTPGGASSQAYEIGPTGTQFATPAKVTFSYGSLSLGGADPATLRVATFASGGWQILSTATFDWSARTISGTTAHLSPYALVIVTGDGGTVDDAGIAPGGPACATVYGGVTCGSIIIGGSSGAGGSAGTVQQPAPDCVPTTCADSDICAAYPGATVTACTDGPGGYTATCCFPAGGSACLATMQFEGCSVTGPDGGLTSTCPNLPRCATDTFACSQYSGATLQDCTDNANGYTGACCFPAGRPVCYVLSSGGFCVAADGATGCATNPTCEDGNPGSLCGAGTGMSRCSNNANGFDVTCCYPLGTLPDTGTMPAGGTQGGVGPAPTGVGGNPGSGGLFGPGKGGTG
jgi:hypothetical protein